MVDWTALARIQALEKQVEEFKSQAAPIAEGDVAVDEDRELPAIDRICPTQSLCERVESNGNFPKFLDVLFVKLEFPRLLTFA